jgi:hypothetical protein
MAIGGPNNPLANLFKNNYPTGVAQNNQTGQVSSTEEKTPLETAKNSFERIAELRAKATDGFGGIVDSNTVAKTAGAFGASPIASSAIKFNENITATSVLGEPSSVAAIDGPVFGEIAAGGNPEVAFGNQQLLLAVKRSQAAGLDDGGGFKGFTATANAELEGYNRLLVG